MAEDAGILLVSLRIAGYLAVLIDEAREGGIVEHHAVLALQVFLAGVEALGHHTLLGTDLGHRTPALALDEDLGLVALVAAYLAAIVVVGAEIPLAVPAVLLDGGYHGIDGLLHSCRLGGKKLRIESGEFSILNLLCKCLAEGYVVFAGDYEEAGNHEALSLGALGDVLCGLEALVGIHREAVQVEAVVPVGTAYEWQGMRAEVVDDVIHRHAEVLEEGHLGARLIVEGHHLVEDGEVARLLDVGHGAEDEPAGVVVESASDVVVAALGEGLILMVAAAVGELCGGDVDDALTGARGYLMDEAHEVLVGVAEAHATADAALEERGRA